MFFCSDYNAHTLSESTTVVLFNGHGVWNSRKYALYYIYDYVPAADRSININNLTTSIESTRFPPNRVHYRQLCGLSPGDRHQYSVLYIVFNRCSIVILNMIVVLLSCYIPILLVISRSYFRNQSVELPNPCTDVIDNTYNKHR
jgi:hypothetical protein